MAKQPNVQDEIDTSQDLVYQIMYDPLRVVPRGRGIDVADSIRRKARRQELAIQKLRQVSRAPAPLVNSTNYPGGCLDDQEPGGIDDLGTTNPKHVRPFVAPN